MLLRTQQQLMPATCLGTMDCCLIGSEIARGAACCFSHDTVEHRNNFLNKNGGCAVVSCRTMQQKNQVERAAQGSARK
eukprot:Skav220173  [mRNA]  locus=scaffold1271:18696:19753:+ [translate_table: standard]